MARFTDGIQGLQANTCRWSALLRLVSRCLPDDRASCPRHLCDGWALPH